MKNKPSVILFGSKPGAIVALELLIARNWHIKAVVPSDNHEFIRSESLLDIAVRYGIEISNQDELPNQKVDFIISYMFRDKITPETLSLAKVAALNFHAGPLPEYGGWAFYNLAILESALEYGCTCHYMDEGFDTGPLLKVRKFAIDMEMETAYSLERKAQEEMVRLFMNFVDMVEANVRLPKVNQDKNKMRYLTKKEFELLKEIPTDSDEETAQRIARAFFYPPYDCAFVRCGSKKLEVIPKIQKNMIAALLHRNDLEDLRNVSKTLSLLSESQQL